MFGFWKDRARHFGWLLEKAQAEAGGLRKEIETHKADKDAAYKACDKLEAKLKGAQSKCEEFAQSLAQARANSNHYEANLAVSRDRERMSNDKVARLTAQHAAVMQVNATLGAGLDDAKHRYEQCEIDRQALAKERDELQRTYDEKSVLHGEALRMGADASMALLRIRDVLATFDKTDREPK